MLHKSDFFAVADDKWLEDRFQIPRTGEVTGIGSQVDDCSEEGQQLEFRADGAYSSFNITAAPGSTTSSSDQRIVVAVYNNLDFLDRIKVPYGRVGHLKDLDISGVSALKIRVTLDNAAACDGKSMFAVLYNMSVS